MPKALTDISYGKELDEPRELPTSPRGTAGVQTHEPAVIRAGEDVDKGLFSDEEWDQLVQAGAVTEDQDEEKRLLEGPAATKSSDVMEKFSQAMPGTKQNPETGLPEGSDQDEEVQGEKATKTASKASPKETPQK